MIDFKKITFISRQNGYFDTGTIAVLESEPDHQYPSGYFRGIRDGFDCGDVCSLFEFDWIDETGNNLRSSIPDIQNMSVLKNWIVKDNDTGNRYNWSKNQINDNFQTFTDILQTANQLNITNSEKTLFLQIEEKLPFLRIEFFVENGEINTESIEISQIIESSFPLSHIQMLKDSILNVFNASELEDDWYEIQVRYTREFQTGDYYDIVPFPYTKLHYKKVYSNE